MNNLKDLQYLEMAYALAEKAKGWASPNPYVGAVVVRKDIIVGYGYHEKTGKPHAEAIALERAGALAKGSTLYVTLEPCVHWGRTPPCADSVIRARPKRVVISSLDPNPLVFQKGVKKIKDAGIAVSIGLLQKKHQALNEAYNKYITEKIPFVTLKAAMSWDGKVATRTSDSQWISSAETREYVHLLRGECDAVMVGINTIIKDDPLLTVRHPQWAGKKMTRVILDSRLRVPLKAKIFSTLSQGNILIFTLRGAPQAKVEALKKRGIEIIPLQASQSGISIKNVLSRLGEMTVSSLLVEGGSLLLTTIFEETLADKIILTFSPKLIGGRTSPSLFGGKGVAFLKDALKLRRTSCFAIGQDTVLEGYF